jgi:hypothetical protein
MPVVMAAGCDDEVALAKPSLPDDMRWHPRVGRIGEVAVACAANKPAVARRIEPADRLAIGDNRSRWCLRLHTAAPSSSTMPTMSATVTVIAVVAVVAVVALVPVMLEVAASLVTVGLMSATTLIVLSVVRSGRLRR